MKILKTKNCQAPRLRAFAMHAGLLLMLSIPNISIATDLTELIRDNHPKCKPYNGLSVPIPNSQGKVLRMEPINGMFRVDSNSFEENESEGTRHIFMTTSNEPCSNTCLRRHNCGFGKFRISFSDFFRREQRVYSITLKFAHDLSYDNNDEFINQAVSSMGIDKLWRIDAFSGRAHVGTCDYNSAGFIEGGLPGMSNYECVFGAVHGISELWIKTGYGENALTSIYVQPSLNRWGRFPMPRGRYDFRHFR